jgi:Sulfatase
MTDNTPTEPEPPPYEPVSADSHSIQQDRPSGRRPISTSDVVLSCVALFALAVSLPLLDLLGRNAEFFLAHASSKLDIVLLGIVLALVIPLLLGFAIAGIFRIHRTTGLVVLAVVIAVLGGVFVIRLLGLTPASSLPAWAELALAIVIGGLVAFAFFRFANARTFIRFTAIAPLVVLGLFLFGSSASELVFVSDAVAGPSQITVEDPAQVVLVVFDEFPVASIMDGDGNIQDDVYPGFARLAEDSTWFRNAVTIQQQSEHSIPAIVSGMDGSHEKLPTAGDYPFTLFTLLADSYDLHVFEAVTDLCPEYACENTTRPTRPFNERWQSLASDLWVVSGHLFLPDDLADNLPPIDSTWSNFSAGTGNSNQAIIARFQQLTYEADRRDPIHAFVELAGEPTDEPRLLFINALVPHVPWNYLPSGQLYDAPGSAPGTKSPGWGDDEWLVDQAYQMHLAQVGYADTILGDLIANLEESGTYDDTLLIVMADHGVTVRPNIKHRRTATAETIGDIAAIPLFIKLPNDDGGQIDDYRAETIDVLPTIADVLGIDLPWAVEGSSLVADERPQRTESHIEGAEGVIVFGVDGSEARAVAARKIQHFGSSGPFGLAPPGYAELLGVSVSDLYVRQAANAGATIRNKNSYSVVDLDGPVVPAWTSGTLRDVAGDSVIAIIVNGDIAAITESREGDDGVVTYGAIVPPDSFENGINVVEIALVHRDGTAWSLTVLPS